ncbi:MAG TPA: Dabb family protein, partial [Sphingobacterium sp.]|nr:Dabb family protein [Sphingobacterium sp.]
MERKDFIKGIVLGGASLGALQSCQSDSTPNTTLEFENGLIFHSVYFWLKEGLSEVEKQDFLKFFEVLRGIPEVAYLSFGKPAPTNPREVVDNSFSYHLITFFKSMDAINIYETHPDHTAAVQEYSK